MSPRTAAVVERLREPSTWAALGVLAAISGRYMPPELVTAGPDLVALVCAALGVVLNERPNNVRD